MKETTLAQMLAELACLDEKIKSVKAREHAAALDTIKALMARHQVSLTDIAEACRPAREQRGLRAAGKSPGKQLPLRDPRQGELL